MKKILVIGRSGQLATALAGLSGADLSVTALSRAELDLAQTDRIADILSGYDMDGVINASAYNFVDAAEADRSEANAVNRDGPTELARACAGRGIPMVHVSTDYVFGDRDGQAQRPFREDDPPAPMNNYGRSKYEGELGVLEAHPMAGVVRTCWVYSASGKNFVTLMLGLAREGRGEVRVVADQVGRPTYAPDLAEACVTVLRRLMENDEAARGVFHYCGADDAGRAEFAEAIFAGARERGLPSADVRRISAAEFAAAAPRPSYSVMESSRIGELLGVQARPWRERLEVCLDEIAARNGAG